MKLKFVIISLVACLNLATLHAQRSIIPVDWNEIKSVVKENPHKVTELVTRLSATELDTTLTYEDRILAFYGQSLLSNDAEEELAYDMKELYKAEKYMDVMSKVNEILSVNPLNIDALYLAAISVSRLCNAGDETYSMDEGQTYYNRAMRLFNTIAVTGYGNSEYPFFVTKVSDEYNFMRHYLDLWEYAVQYLAGTCDVFELSGQSKYYNEQLIYFDASRPLEITMCKLAER